MNSRLLPLLLLLAALPLSGQTIYDVNQQMSNVAQDVRRALVELKQEADVLNTVAQAAQALDDMQPATNLDNPHISSPTGYFPDTGRFTYVVLYHRIVPPTAMWVTRNVGYDRLVLSACNPLYSAAQRIIVFARLDRVASSAKS